MIVVSQTLLLQLQAANNANNPVIGYRSFFNAAGVVADSEQTFYPASNLANPATDPTQSWKSDSLAEQKIDFTISELEEVNYVGIARHNLGSGEISIQIESHDVNDPGNYDELIPVTLLANDDVALFRFPDTATDNIRINLDPQSDAKPSIAVAFVGKLLVMQRGIYVGHTPITLGRRHEINSGRNSRGDFLGRIVTSKSRSTVAAVRNLKPDWYRSEFDPFAKQAVESPFFFAWRPQSYPAEVGYCWLSDDPRPSNSLPNGMMQVEIPIEGIAE
jgi:hypothetical protein